MVKAEENTPPALLAALLPGRYYSTQGPAIEEIHFEGDHLDVRTSPAKQIALVGPHSKSTYASGVGLTEARLPVERLKDSWCRLVVLDAENRSAWSNPLSADFSR